MKTIPQDARLTHYFGSREIRDKRLTHREVHSVACPHCEQPAGARCRTSTGWGARSHAKRVKVAGQRLDQGEPETVRFSIRWTAVLSSGIPADAYKLMTQARMAEKTAEIEFVLFGDEKTARLVIDGKVVASWEDQYA
jgi:hypothetical protein